MDKYIYLDNNSTTQVDKRVVEEMIPFFTSLYANSASTHLFGVEVNNAVKKARSLIADLIGCDINEIVFTSGATEGINLAIKGLADTYSHKGKHIITVQTEHNAVLDVCKYLETKGFEITYLPVDNNGLINLSELKSNIRKDTILVSVMLVNNEIGVIQPIEEIAEITHCFGSVLMSDVTQGIGKISVNVNELGIDLLAFSGHKFYGPKGIGGLYVRSKRPNKIKLSPIIHGGGHEMGVRSGTINVPGIIGLGKAAEIAMQNTNSDAIRIKNLRDKLENELLKIENTSLNGHKEKRVCNTSNICFKDVDADAIITGLKTIIVSNGSACTSNYIHPSHVLKALGKTDDEAYSSIRFSLGRFNVPDDIQNTINKINTVVSNLLMMSNSYKVS